MTLNIDNDNDNIAILLSSISSSSPSSPSSSLTNDINIKYMCKNCNDTNETFNYCGNVYCKNCFADFGGIIDTSAEWRTFETNGEVETARAGDVIHPLLIESSYSTMIPIAPDIPWLKTIGMINKWTSMPAHERSLKLVFDKLTRIGRNNNFTDNIIEHSHYLYNEIIDISNEQKIKLNRGDNRDGLIATCFYYACKDYELIHTASEIAIMFNIPESLVTKGIKNFNKVMAYKKKAVSHFKIEDFIYRYYNDLKINDVISLNNIISILNIVRDKNMLQKNTPQSIAIGIIYFVLMKNRKTDYLDLICENCNISQLTVQKIYDKLCENENLK